jgi:hypothetical protein
MTSFARYWHMDITDGTTKTPKVPLKDQTRPSKTLGELKVELPFWHFLAFGIWQLTL